MKSFTRPRALQAALIGIAMTGAATLAHADVKDYEFQLIDQMRKPGCVDLGEFNLPDGKLSQHLFHDPWRDERCSVINVFGEL